MGAAVWDRASAPAPFKGAALIVALGALAALWLLGSDAAYDNIRVVSSVERINHDKLVHGAEMEILQGHSPLRTATGVESDIGNPYHQFYSPFAHLVMGLWSLLAGDIV
ncbi:MAG: hypothetical protein LBO66_01800, partial [Deltaproteobacteria bacterium]|nr:hypothetical protein [Deltaproteobacteria bacterium]